LRRTECTPGTYVNVLHGITSWAVSLSPDGEVVFWLSGQAGSGKTTIAFTVAHYLGNLARDDTSKVVLGASFFCSRQFPDTRSVSSIIRTIVYQLAVVSKSFQTALQEHGNFDAVDHGPRSQMLDLLAKPWKASAPARLASGEPCYVVPIDALDELEGSGGTEFLGALFDVVNEQDLSGLKFFVTSRLEPTLVKQITAFPNKQVCRLEEVSLEESSADIKVFLSAHLALCATTQQIHQLASDAAGLFIHAATVVTYLKGRDVEEQKSLVHRILSSSSSPNRRPSRAVTATLDSLYLQILETSLVDPRERDDPGMFQDCLAILHTFLCTIERTSTSVAVDILNASAGESDAQLDVGIAKGVLYRLHAVLYSQGGLVMTYHKSFADFLFDAARSQRFFCNQEDHHRRLAHGCFGIMMDQLRFNIADIATSFLMDCDNLALQTAIDANISISLRYVSRRWSDHLALASPLVDAQDGLAEALHRFLRLPVLFWMETMNLLGQWGQCSVMLRVAQRWSFRTKVVAAYVLLRRTLMSSLQSLKELVGQLSDAASLSAYHGTSKAVLSTPHLYLSSLATFPRHSAMVENWRKQLESIPGFIAAHGEGGGVEVTCITTRFWRLYALAVSPDGVHIAFAVDGLEGTIRIWDLTTAKEVSALKLDEGDIAFGVAYSPDGRYLVSGSLNTSVRVWDVSTEEAVNMPEGHTAQVRTVAYSPDGKHIVSGSDDKTLRVWELPTGQMERVLEGHASTVNTVTFSPDGTRVVSGSTDKTIRVWDVSTGEETMVITGHTGGVMTVACSPDGRHVVSGSSDKTLRVWDLSTGEAERVLKGHTNWVNSVAYSPDGAHVVSSSNDKSIRVWGVSTGEERTIITGSIGPVGTVAYLPDGTQIVSILTGGSTVQVWDVSLGAAERTVHMKSPINISKFVFSPDGSQVFSCSADGILWVWDWSAGRERRELRKGHDMGEVFGAAYSPDGTRVVCGSADKTVRVLHVSTGEEVRVMNGHSGPVICVAWSPDGSCIVSGSHDTSIRVWKVSTGEELRILMGHSISVSALAYSPDGNHLVSSSIDTSTRVWNLCTGEQVWVQTGLTKVVAYSPDGSQIISGIGKSVWARSSTTGEELWVLEGRIGHLHAVAYSPDGSQIIVSGNRSPPLDTAGSSIWVWDTSTRDNIRVLNVPAAKVLAATYLPGGTQVICGFSDGSIWVWDTSSEHSPHYIREQGPDGKYTGWLVSPTNPSDYLMFVRPDALLPDDDNVRTIPSTAVSHLDLSFAKLGDRWAECYAKKSL
jgi:WD40 repeat protein